MLLGRNKGYLGPGEDITSKNLTYYGSRIELLTKVNNQSLFVNDKIVAFFRDLESESKKEFINEPRFQFEHGYTEDNLELLKLKNLLLKRKKVQIISLYQPFKLYLKEEQIIKKKFTQDMMNVVVNMPFCYKLAGFLEENGQIHILFKNIIPVIAPPNEFGEEVNKEDIRLILSLEKRKNNGFY